MNVFDLFFPKKCLECGQGGRYICDECIKKVPRGGWYGPRVYSIWRYKGVVRSAIIALKYKFATDVADELVEICTLALKKQRITNNKNLVLVPIPLHRSKENSRGFNQAELVGEKIAQKMGWGYAPGLLIRTKATTPQVQLKGVDRRRNLSGVFAVNTRNNLWLGDDYTLVVFDDVLTTGSTIKEAVDVLARTGFGDILALTMAR